MRGLATLPATALVAAACATSPAATRPAATPPPPAPAAAPAAERGAFVVRLGSDTIAVERYTRDAARIEGDEAVRVPAPALRHYAASLNADGSVATLDYQARRLAGDTTPSSASVRFGADTVTVAMKLAGRDTTLRYAARGALPYVNLSYGLLELLTTRAVRQPGDTSRMLLVALGAPTAISATLTRVGSDSLAFAVFNQNAYHIRVDDRGRIVGLQGLSTTQKVLVDRVSDVDVRAYANRWAGRDTTRKSTP
jgi:hypothetical protein